MSKPDKQRLESNKTVDVDVGNATVGVDNERERSGLDIGN